MTLQGRALEGYMKFSIVPVGFSYKMLDQIWVGMIYEFRNSKYELKCITQIKDIKQLPT